MVSSSSVKLVNLPGCKFKLRKIYSSFVSCVMYILFVIACTSGCGGPTIINLAFVLEKSSHALCTHLCVNVTYQTLLRDYKHLERSTLGKLQVFADINFSCF